MARPSTTRDSSKPEFGNCHRPAARKQLSLRAPQGGFWGHDAVTTAGLCLLDNDVEPHPTLEFYKFATNKISAVLTLDEKAARLQPSLSATADGKTLY